MTKSNETTQHDQDTEMQTDGARATDDRRGDVKPTDNPVPSSPEADRDAVRDGQETLERVKPY